MKKLNKKGFTIVELVIVIGVIGILSAILIPTFVNLTDQAKEKQIQANLRNAYSAYVAEAADGKVDATGAEIKLVAENEVILVDGSDEYQINNEGVWGKISATANKYVVDGDTDGSLSTFNGIIVRYYQA